MRNGRGQAWTKLEETRVWQGRVGGSLRCAPSRNDLEVDHKLPQGAGRLRAWVQRRGEGRGETLFLAFFERVQHSFPLLPRELSVPLVWGSDFRGEGFRGWSFSGEGSGSARSRAGVGFYEHRCEPRPSTLQPISDMPNCNSAWNSSGCV